MGAAAAVVIAGGAGAWLVFSSPTEAATEPITMTVTSGTQRETVSATGTVESAEQADLSFAVSGEVTSVLVAEGDVVTAGQVLATVDDTVLQAELVAAESTLAAAETRLADDTDADASDAQLAADEAAVASASSQLTSAQEALDQASLLSTIDGTVAAVDLVVGDQVAGGSGGGSSPAPSDSATTAESTAQVTVVSTNRYVVQASVSSSDVADVTAGLQAEITPVDVTEPVYGTVSSVGLVATADDSGAAMFPVTIEVTGERDDIYAGSSAAVTIIVSQQDDVLTVPSQALNTEGDTTYVYTIVDGERVRADVEIGTAYGQQTEVISGLADGDVVEITGFTRQAPTGGGGGGGGGQLPPGGGPPGGGMAPGGQVRPGGGS